MSQALIITERTCFRLYALEDKDRFVALMTDAEVMRFVGDGPMTEAAAGNLWRRLTEEFYPQGIKSIWAVISREDGRYLGHASIRPRPEYPAEWEIGYILLKEEWGRGLATEIAVALVRHGYENLALSEVFATVDDDHATSIGVLRKAGFGFLRHEYDEDGRYSVYRAEKPSE